MARAIPFLDYSLVVLTSIVFIHYIGSLASRSTPSVCLTGSPRPNVIYLFICLRHHPSDRVVYPNNGCWSSLDLESFQYNSDPIQHLDLPIQVRVPDDFKPFSEQFKFLIMFVSSPSPRHMAIIHFERLAFPDKLLEVLDDGVGFLGFT